MTTVFINASRNILINIQNTLLVKFIEIYILFNLVFQTNFHNCLDQVVSKLVKD
jgi:hypothetical protein